MSRSAFEATLWCFHPHFYILQLPNSTSLEWFGLVISAEHLGPKRARCTRSLISRYSPASTHRHSSNHAGWQKQCLCIKMPHHLESTGQGFSSAPNVVQTCTAFFLCFSEQGYKTERKVGEGELHPALTVLTQKCSISKLTLYFIALALERHSLL